MRPLILICIALNFIAMAGVEYLATEMVDHWGPFSGIIGVAAMYAAAVYWDRRSVRSISGDVPARIIAKDD